MKKLIFLILILFACQKEKEYCYICNVLSITTATGTGYASGSDKSVVTINKCGITQKAIDEFEAIETSTATVKQGSITVTVNSTCTCVRQ